LFCQAQSEKEFEKVYAMEDRNIYPTKRKIPNKEMDALNILNNDLLGKWNYIIKPKI